MISLASVQTTNNINFKAVPEYSKKITGEMKYALSNQVGAIKSAIIDILRRAKSNTLNEKAKAILERYNITITDSVKIASLLGIGSLATFFIKEENDGTESLGLKIEQPNKRTATYIFDKNKV